MRLTKKRFVLLFLAVGYAFDFATKFLLNQARDAVWASPNQAAWQRFVSTILADRKSVV